MKIVKRKTSMRLAKSPAVLKIVLYLMLRYMPPNIDAIIVNTINATPTQNLLIRYYEKLKIF